MGSKQIQLRCDVSCWLSLFCPPENSLNRKPSNALKYVKGGWMTSNKKIVCSEPTLYITIFHNVKIFNATMWWRKNVGTRKKNQMHNIIRNIEEEVGGKEKEQRERLNSLTTFRWIFVSLQCATCEHDNHFKVNQPFSMFIYLCSIHLNLRK